MENLKQSIDVVRDSLQINITQPVSGIDHSIVNKYPNGSKINVNRDSDGKNIIYTINNHKLYDETGAEL